MDRWVKYQLLNFVYVYISYLINYCGPGWKNISFPRIHHLLNFFESQFNKVLFLFQFKFHLNLGYMLHCSAFTFENVYVQWANYVILVRHNSQARPVHVCSWSTAGKCWQHTVCVFVELWACQAAQGRHHMLARFMNAQVKGAKCYALQNKFTKVKKNVLPEGHAHAKDRFVHLKAIMAMFSCRFNFQILHWQWNLISCLIRFICNEKEREVGW